MKDRGRETGTVTALAPAGGVITPYGGGVVYISNFDPLRGKLPIGTVVSFITTWPGDHRPVAKDLRIEK